MSPGKRGSLAGLQPAPAAAPPLPVRPAAPPPAEVQTPEHQTPEVQSTEVQTPEAVKPAAASAVARRKPPARPGLRQRCRVCLSTCALSGRNC